MSVTSSCTRLLADRDALAARLVETEKEWQHAWATASDEIVRLRRVIGEMNSGRWHSRAWRAIRRGRDYYGKPVLDQTPKVAA